MGKNTIGAQLLIYRYYYYILNLLNLNNLMKVITRVVILMCFMCFLMVFYKTFCILLFASVRVSACVCINTHIYIPTYMLGHIHFNVN